MGGGYKYSSSYGGDVKLLNYFTKRWYKDGCKPIPTIEDKEYINYDSHVHDCEIKSNYSYKLKGNILRLLVDNEGSFGKLEEIVFIDYEIKEISCYKDKGWWCIADEIYKINDYYEYHLLLQHFKDDGTDILENFTVKCSCINFVFADKTETMRQGSETEQP